MQKWANRTQGHKYTHGTYTTSFFEGSSPTWVRAKPACGDNALRKRKTKQFISAPGYKVEMFHKTQMMACRIPT